MKDPPVIPEFTMEDLCHLGMNIFKHGGKSYLVIANAASGYCWCEYLGKYTTSKDVLDMVRKLFLKLSILFTVQMDGGLEFHGPFQALLKEFRIEYTPSSLYNPESNGLAERYMGLTKLLLKDCLDP